MTETERLILILLASFAVGFTLVIALAVIIGASKRNQQWDEANKRIERELHERELIEARQKWETRIGHYDRNRTHPG